MKHTNFQQEAVAPVQEKIVERVVYADRPVQVELTDKKYKRWMMRGDAIKAIGILTGIIGTVISIKYEKLYLIPYFIIGALITVFVGALIWQIAKQQAWWNNG